MILSIDGEKSFDKIQHPDQKKKKKKNSTSTDLKTPCKLAMERNFLSLMKDIYKKSTANIIWIL